MSQISSQVNANSPEYKTNFSHNQALAEELAGRQRQAAFDRPEKTVARQRERGKLLVRERIEAIIDANSPFLELSPLAAWEMYDG
jgi:3-methylcrotonyl-CoA carboxylase beta subunit